jgi:hypothetical protein
MSKKIVFGMFWGLGLILSNHLVAKDEAYRIFFADKAGSSINPVLYFSPEALERRALLGLPAFDFYDLPVSEIYLSTLLEYGVEIHVVSRWLNAVFASIPQEMLSMVEQLSFIQKIEIAHPSKLLLSSFNEEDAIESDTSLYLRQTDRMGIRDFHNQAITGKGVRIAIFDVGFNGADEHPAFKHIYDRKGVIATYDFVKKREQVYQGGSHGTSVWSCIAGFIDNQWAGMAKDAEFLLARTEIGGSEPFAEELYWVAAAEWADKNGAHIINSSLGYTGDRYFPHQMDGKTTYVSRGANMAARKGILVVNAAGNDGSNNWSIIGAPADADSVLTVGGVLPCCDYHINFSSFGPTRDFRIKPDVSAQGRVKAAKPKGSGSVDGTSFASPLIAGFAACTKQQFPALAAMELHALIRSAGHLYPYADYAHGYGVPHATRLQKTITKEDSFSVLYTAESIEVVIADHAFSEDAEAKTQLLYYHTANQAGQILRYFVVDIQQKNALKLFKSEFDKGEVLRIAFKGTLKELKF